MARNCAARSLRWVGTARRGAAPSPAAVHPCTAIPHSPPQAFPAISEEQLGALLPGKGGLVQSKLSNRCVVYSLEGGSPLFFDPSGRGDGLLPTVRLRGGWQRLRALCA